MYLEKHLHATHPVMLNLLNFWYTQMSGFKLIDVEAITDKLPLSIGWWQFKECYYSTLFSTNLYYQSNMLSTTAEIQKVVDEQSKAGAKRLEEIWVDSCVEMIKSQQQTIEAIMPHDEVSSKYPKSLLIFLEISYNREFYLRILRGLLLF